MTENRMDVSPQPDEPPPLRRGTAAAVARFERNTAGRDFVVGDIHGMFLHLERLLERVSFDGTRDRLFSVGDLVDRGPRSRDALAWIEQPWFFAVRGNHEQFAIDSDDPHQRELWINFNGGAWWLELAPELQVRFREAFESLPLAIEIETGAGRVGVVHADVPPAVDWDEFTRMLEANERDAVLYALWSRNRITGYATTAPVGGDVTRVYCGHTPTRHTVQLDNVCYIDTGAAYINDGYAEARLTVVEIHPELHREYTIHTGSLG